MGWYYGPGTRKELVRELTQGEDFIRHEMLVKRRCLKHCIRGGHFRAVLWSVWEISFEREDGSPADEPTQRWINCDLLECNGGMWGHKPMCESMGPYYYSCPLGYLDLVPIEQYGGNAEWREIVREHHQRANEKRRAKKAAMV